MSSRSVIWSLASALRAWIDRCRSGHGSRRPARVFVVIVGLLSAVLSRDVSAQSPIDGFDPDAGGSVLALAIQTDGKILVGGDFTTIAGATRNHLARLNADGSLDASFAVTDVASRVRAIVVQADGRIVIGGEFDQVGVYARNRIARLNTDGTVDASYDPNASGIVRSLAVQPDGKLLVGGDYTSMTPNGGATIARNRIARLNVDGSVDAAFDPNASGSVFTVATQTDGKVLIGGGFASLAPNGGASIPRSKFARLNPDGSVDFAFDPSPNGAVHAVVLQLDGELLVGGVFSTFTPNGGTTVSRNRIARLNPDGSVDPSFDPNASSTVRALALQPDGKVVLAGDFVSLTPNGGTLATRNRVARVNADGSLDPAFDPEASATVDALAIQSDGKVLMSGSFVSLAPNGGATVTRNRIARAHDDGTLDGSFNANADSTVYAFAQQPDGKLIVGGGFSSLHPTGGPLTTRHRIARVNPDGSVDPVFDPDVSGGLVYAIVVQPDGRIVIGGDFTSLSPNGGPSVVRKGIARLNSDGGVDLSFDPSANNGVHTLALQPDGKLLVGGPFTAFTPYGALQYTRRHIARLNPDGSIDPAFDPNADSSVEVVAVQPDGKVLIGGNFLDLAPNGGPSVTRHFIARLDADDGSVETAFNPNPNTNGSVRALVLQPDGRIVVGGSFSSFAPNGGATVARSRLARLNADGSVDMSFDPGSNANMILRALALQADGRILVGGDFGASTTAPSRIIRLEPYGGLDASFDISPSDTVYSVGLQADGKALVGGVFQSTYSGSVGDVPRGRIARIGTPQGAPQSLSFVGYPNGFSTVTWMRSGSAPELALPPTLLFEVAEGVFVPIDTMQRIDGGWRFHGYFLPPQHEIFALRARGQFSAGQYSASSSVIETTRRFYLDGNDGIFTDSFE